MSINKPDSVFVVLSLGSNLGDRQDNINKAVELLKSAGVIDRFYVSSFYETEPVGPVEQPWFINAAIAGFTSLPLNELLLLCKSIEYSVGRVHRKRWSERELDIDILIYGSSRVNRDKLTVPHPRMHERRFVLVPAAEIAGSTVHPIFGRTIRQLLEECEDKSIVKLSA